MIKRIFDFILLNCYLHLLNIPFFLNNKFLILPYLVKEGFLENCRINYSDDIIAILIFPAILSFILEAALKKRSKVLIIYLIIHNLYVIYSWISNDTFDGEFIYTSVTSVCRLVQTIQLCIFSRNELYICCIINKLNFTVIYSFYVYIVYYTFKFWVIKSKK